MRVLVVGAAGKTGQAVVARAFHEGHEVTAFVHSEGSFDIPGVEVRAVMPSTRQQWRPRSWAKP